MAGRALFEGLVVDEFNQVVDVAYIGDEACYVVNDRGFRRHIPAEDVDRQVLQIMKKMVEDHEDLLTEQTTKMIGQEDIFTRAMIQNQLKHIDQQFENLLQTGIPEEGRAYMGMMGFRITINVHGEVIRLDQPGTTTEED